MLRSAAKNHESVTVVMDPADYAEVAGQIAAAGEHDAGIAAAAGGEGLCRERRPTTGRSPAIWPRHSGRGGRLMNAPAAGEPWPAQLQLTCAWPQTIALRRESAPTRRALRAVRGLFPATARQGTVLQQYPGFDGGGGAGGGVRRRGRRPWRLSNIPIPAARARAPLCAKRGKRRLPRTSRRPLAASSLSISPLDLACAEAITEIFSEVIVAPDFAPEALELLRKKKNLRLMKALQWPARRRRDWNCAAWAAESVLAQDRDAKGSPARNGGW